GGFERALHQIDRFDHDRRLELQGAERRLEPGEIARPGLPSRPTERHMRTKRARFGGEAEWGEFLLDAMLQDFQPRVRGDARPDPRGSTSTTPNPSAPSRRVTAAKRSSSQGIHGGSTSMRARSP